MGGGDIEIERMENSTNGQVTYSKRRARIMKKAEKFSVLCDAQVSLLMVSNNNKLTEYTSPGITTKDFYHKYQQISGHNLWESDYEKMQADLRQLKEMNTKLRKQIRQRVGEDLDGLSFNELRGLEQNLETFMKTVQKRKETVLTIGIESCKKKLRNLQEQQEVLEKAHAQVTIEEGMAALELTHGGALDKDYGYGFHDLRLA